MALACGFVCGICASRYLKATVDRLLSEGEFDLAQIANLVHQPVMAIVMHEREWVAKYIKNIETTSLRLEAAMAVIQARHRLRLDVYELPMTSEHQLELPDGKRVTMTIHFEEAAR